MSSLRMMAVAAATALPLVLGSSAAFSAAHETGAAATPGGGACSFTQKNMFAGPFKDVAAGEMSLVAIGVELHLSQ